jgi:hypothetical protein
MSQPKNFLQGHPRYGGRKPGSKNRRTQQAIDICEALDFHPAAFLATIALTGLMPNPDGTTTPVTAEERIRAATSLAPFVMPRLQSTQVTGANDGPIETQAQTLDINKLLSDPAALEAAQRLALMICESDQAPEPAKICGPVEDEKDIHGHWA